MPLVILQADCQSKIWNWKLTQFDILLKPSNVNRANLIVPNPPPPLSTQPIHWDRGRLARKQRRLALAEFEAGSSLGPRASRPQGAPQARTSFLARSANLS